MSCGCGSGCSNCKEIQVKLPTSNGISSVVDNGDGTFTITETNGTATIITMVVPNDVWVEFDESTNIATAPTFTGTGSLNGVISLDGAYKVLNVDSIFIRCQARMNVDITALTDSINFNFDLGTITSNWYAGTKLSSMTTNSGATQGLVPISIRSTTGSARPNNIGTAYAIEIPAPDGLIAVGNTNLQLANGTYDFLIDFEMTCKLV